MGLFTSFQLKSRDPETRRRAALKLGVRGRRSAVEELRPLIDDPEWTVREAAAAALGVIAEAEGVPLLLAAIRGAENVRPADGATAVRRAAVAGLVGVGPAAVAALLEALRDRDARLREAVLEALGGIGGPECVEALAAALSDDRSNVRQAAAPALARAGGPKAVPALSAALAHKDAATRRAAAAALGVASDPAAAEALRLAAADRDRSVREAAMHSLAALKTGAAVHVLCQVMLEGDREAKAAAATALRSFDWPPAGGRQRAVHAVLHGRYDDAAREGTDAVEPLLAALTDRDAAARSGATRAIGQLGDPRIVAALAPLLADRDASVRDAAAQSLAAQGTAAAHELTRALAEPAPATDAAAKALALLDEGRVAAAILAPLIAGKAARHGALALRVVHEQESLDEARQAADSLETLVSKLAAKLPAETLQAIAALDDVMLVEAGRRPDPDLRVGLDEVRGAAAAELERRASRP